MALTVRCTGCTPKKLLFEVLFLAPTGAQGEGMLDLRPSVCVCVCTLLNTALKKLPDAF